MFKLEKYWSGSVEQAGILDSMWVVVHEDEDTLTSIVLSLHSQVGIGKDHTLFALEPGYVRFYKQSRGTDIMDRYAKGLSVRQLTSALLLKRVEAATAKVENGTSTGSSATSGTSDRIIRRERRYIGIALTPQEQLPRDEASVGRSRRLGLQQLGGVGTQRSSVATL